NVYAQTGDKWYYSLPKKAEWITEGTLMKIGNKNYHVYNSFDPIAPKGGERVIDFAGVLNYYMWTFKNQDGFSVAIIDMKLNIFYYDEETEKYTSPAGDIFKEL
ncbi:MAG: hypothetical protein LBG72_03455, partial [Spirochaetaceae bacterium]|nr:hypothetical protein [Spirochaetaceae bacterium]